ncbi:hypothetical protein BC833DRAFT_605212, partial [Globomyces pollinis-pini]
MNSPQKIYKRKIRPKPPRQMTLFEISKKVIVNVPEEQLQQTVSDNHIKMDSKSLNQQEQKRNCTVERKIVRNDSIPVELCEYDIEDVQPWTEFQTEIYTRYRIIPSTVPYPKCDQVWNEVQLPFALFNQQHAIITTIPKEKTLIRQSHHKLSQIDNNLSDSVSEGDSDMTPTGLYHSSSSKPIAQQPLNETFTLDHSILLDDLLESEPEFVSAENNLIQHGTTDDDIIYGTESEDDKIGKSMFYSMSKKPSYPSQCDAAVPTISPNGSSQNAMVKGRRRANNVIDYSSDEDMIVLESQQPIFQAVSNIETLSNNVIKIPQKPTEKTSSNLNLNDHVNLFDRLPSISNLQKRKSESTPRTTKKFHPITEPAQRVTDHISTKQPSSLQKPSKLAPDKFMSLIEGLDKVASKFEINTLGPDLSPPPDTQNDVTGYVESDIDPQIAKLFESDEDVSVVREVLQETTNLRNPFVQSKYDFMHHSQNPPLSNSSKVASRVSTADNTRISKVKEPTRAKLLKNRKQTAKEQIVSLFDSDEDNEPVIMKETYTRPINSSPIQHSMSSKTNTTNNVKSVIRKALMNNPKIRDWSSPDKFSGFGIESTSTTMKPAGVDNNAFSRKLSELEQEGPSSDFYIDQVSNDQTVDEESDDIAEGYISDSPLPGLTNLRTIAENGESLGDLEMYKHQFDVSAPTRRKKSTTAATSKPKKRTFSYRGRGRGRGRRKRGG